MAGIKISGGNQNKWKESDHPWIPESLRNARVYKLFATKVLFSPRRASRAGSEMLRNARFYKDLEGKGLDFPRRASRAGSEMLRNATFYKDSETEGLGNSTAKTIFPNNSSGIKS